MTGRIIDITCSLDANLAGWPGDTPYRFSLAWSKAGGASVNVGRIETSLHTGTHADAPFHFDDSGPTVDQLDLLPFLGPSRVVDVRGVASISVDDLVGFDLAQSPRILFRTDAWVDRSRFPATIPVLDLDVPGYLARQGVLLVGFDLPSVDAIESKTLPVHHALASSGIAILEGLDLTQVEAGEYDLIALPIKLVGADGAPVRAVLRSREHPQG